jgi:predicted alpha/beta superfamily hydrolase
MEVPTTRNGGKMKKLILVIWLMLFTFASAQMQQSQTTNDLSTKIDQIKTEPIVTGYSFKLHSEILNEDRTILIALPGDYEKSKKNYPVIYLTDGQWNFNVTSQAIGSQSGNGLAPQMIVVAIQTLENRDRDLVATRNEQEKMGGATDNFYSFLTKELVPFIEKNYRTFPYRAICGTSFGGIFVVHSFIKNPKFFDSYLALSPSMGWDDGIFLKRSKDFLINNPDLKNSLYFCVANEGLEMGVNSYAEILQKYSPQGLKWKFEEYPKEVHGTIPYLSTYNGLRFVFSEWSSEPTKFTTKGDLINPGDTVIVTINNQAKDIFYTLDGSLPSQNSPRYEKPLTITKPTTIKVFPLFGYGIPGNCDSLEVYKVPTLKAETNLPELKNGLKYSYYEGSWDTLPDFEKLTPLKSDITPDLKMQERNTDLNFAIKYAGYIDIQEDNIYTFNLISDDGSRLLIDGTQVINNDGLHASIEKSGKASLKKGKHKIEVLFFQKGGGFNLYFSYEAPGIQKQKIPESFFYN